MRKLAIKTRSNKIETEHYGFVALCNSQGKLDKTLCDEESFYVRSCIKAIQTKVCKDILGNQLKDEFLTLSAASHLSTPKQLEILNKMLNDFQIEEKSLYCGTKSSNNVERFKSKLRHHCAGKHIAHLAASKAKQFKDNYYDSKHPIQESLYKELLRLSQTNSIETALDGCGLPTFYMSMPELASSFTKASQEPLYQEIFKTINQYAHLISDSGRFDQELMLQFPNRFFAKSGADGMLLITNLDSFETLVIKILDGEKRIKDIVAKNILELLTWIKRDELVLNQSIYTSQGHITGELIGLDSL